MPILAEATLHLPGLTSNPPGLLIAVGGLSLGLLILYHGLHPLEPVLGHRTHKMLGSAALGLFTAWALVIAAWLLGAA